MKLTRCDRHPEREAVATLAIRVHAAGYRPLLPSFGPNQSTRYFDMCSECRSSILFDGEDAAAAKAHSEHAV
jgi:hypothetical protein